jgi:glutathione synthase/RimK-type ligase-like ATP-grasp enzyme
VVILFYGYGDDTPLVRALEETRERGLDHVLVDQRLADQHDLMLRIGDDGVDGEVHQAGAVLRLADVKAVYARPLSPVPVTDPRGAERAGVLARAFVDWLDVAGCRVVNRPSSMHSNASKPFQAQAIGASGLAVPETLVTSDPEAARAFWRQHGAVIFKSTSGIRSIVRRLDADAATRLEHLRDLPTQFQAYEEGTDVRVHVVADRVFAAEVRSEAVDYRYARREGLEVELCGIDLEAGVAEACVRLARDLGLDFCGIDLRRRPDGGYVCFEVNPMPGYSYYESETGQPISGALVDLLAGGGC